MLRRSPKWSPSNFYVFRLCRRLVQACSWTWVGYDLLKGLRKKERCERVCEFVFLEWRLYTFDFLILPGWSRVINDTQACHRLWLTIQSCVRVRPCNSHSCDNPLNPFGRIYDQKEFTAAQNSFPPPPPLLWGRSVRVVTRQGWVTTKLQNRGLFSVNTLAI